MKLRFLLIPITAICMVSSCSSCGEGTGNNNNNGSLSGGDSTSINGLGGDSMGIVETVIDESTMTETELLQHDLNVMIKKQLQAVKKSKVKAGEVETMIAGFELGMNTREVKKHMLRMKQKNHLVRVQKSANVFEYVYQLDLESGKSNTYLDFKYSRAGGVYKAVCKPTTFKKMSKGAFLKEVRNLLVDWYGGANFQLPSKRGCKRYVWIKGNRHIDLYCTSEGVEFVYTDLTVEIPKNIEGGGSERPDDIVM